MNQAIASRAEAVHADQTQGRGLHVVPILGPSHDQPAYELLRPETLSRVQITEISAAGSVPDLQVRNDLDTMVYLMDGQELVGAKQNRILNTDVLVPARSALTIPVSCVEQGRWRHVSNQFAAGKSASQRIRAAKAARVHASLRTEQRHDAGQAAVWEEVHASLASSGTASPTSALSDAYKQRDADLQCFRRDLKLPAEAVGLAVFHGGEFQGLDLFDRHSTLQYFWESLLDSYAIDFLSTPPADAKLRGTAEAEVIAKVLGRAVKGRWEPFESPGAGQDWRWQDRSYSGSSLVWEDRVVVHLQVFPKAKQNGSEVAPRRPGIRRRYGT
jgi:hypothetical protein